MARLSTVTGPNASNVVGTGDEPRSFATMTPAEKIAAGLDVVRQRGGRPSPENISSAMQILSMNPDAYRMTAPQAAQTPDMIDELTTSGTAPVEPVAREMPYDTAEALEREQPGTAEQLARDGLIPPEWVALLALRPNVGTGSVPATQGTGRRNIGDRAVATAEPDVARAQFEGVRGTPAVETGDAPRVEAPQRTGRRNVGDRAPTPTTEDVIMDLVARETPDMLPAPRQETYDVAAAEERPRGNANMADTPDTMTTPVEPRVLERQIGTSYIDRPEGRVRVIDVVGEDGVEYGFSPQTGELYDDRGRPIRRATDAEISRYLSDARISRILRSVR